MEDILATDRAIDVTFTKRMSNRFSLVTSYYFNWDRDFEFVQNPNDERFDDQTVTNWNFKVFGTYQAPWGIATTGSLRHQSGTPISRDIVTVWPVGPKHHPDRGERLRGRAQHCLPYR